MKGLNAGKSTSSCQSIALHWLLKFSIRMLQPLVSSQGNSDQPSTKSTMAGEPRGIGRKVQRNKCRAPAMQMDEAKKNKKFPKGCGAFMEDRSSRTNKYSGLKGPNLGTRQKQMGGEGLLYTCPAVYIPFLKIYSVILFSAAEKTCGHRDSPLPAAANVTVPGKPQNVSANHGKSNLQFKAIQEALSELSRSCWCSELLNKPITSPLLPKCVLLRGGT